MTAVLDSVASWLNLGNNAQSISSKKMPLDLRCLWTGLGISMHGIWATHGSTVFSKSDDNE
jgi:hypothetical protein